MITWKTALFAIILGTWALECLVELLNLRCRGKEPPPEFRDRYDDDRFAKAGRYLKENTRFGLARSTVFTLLALTAICCGWFGILDEWCRHLISNPTLRALPFWGTLTCGGILVSLPFAIYRTFSIEARFGFNRTTWRTFVADRIKGICLTIVLAAPLLLGVVWFFDRFELAWLYAWGAIVSFQLVMAFVAPALILPIFNRFEPLEDGELKDAVLAYAASQDFQLRGLFTMDGSRRSSKANAFFTGFGRFRRIVLFDTLVENHTTEELVAVLAHEMGHFKKRHIPIGIFISAATLAAMLFLTSKIIALPGIHAAFGTPVSDPPVYAGLLFATILFGPLDLALSIGGNWLSRRFEYQADRYAMETVPDGGNHLAEALMRMTSDALGNLTPHPMKVFLEYSHPPVVERIRHLRS